MYLATSLITGAVAGAALTGVQVVRRPPIVSRSGGDVIAVTGSITLASGTNLAANDVIELAILPADHLPIDFLLYAGQWDSNAAPTLAANFGVMTGAVGDASRNQATVGTEGGAAVKWGSVAGCTARAGQSNGTASTLTLVQYAQSLALVTPSTTADRSFGMAITAAAATNPATTRRLDFTLFYRSTAFGA